MTAAVVEVVFEERYWYPEDGGIVWVAGYQLVDRHGAFIGRDAPQLAERGLIVCNVAGARHNEAGLQGDVAPGSRLELVRDPANPHDANAVIVKSGGVQVGWVPREVAGRVAADLDAGRAWAALVLRERRASPREPRTGLTMLLAAGGAIELRDRRRR